LVKERLTGAIILVVLIVLLVPELLSGPSRSAPAPQAAATSSEEPPLRSYTINLADESHATAAPASGSNVSPQSSGPAQPTPIVEQPAAQQAAGASTESSSEQTQESLPSNPPATAGSQEVSPEQPQASPLSEQRATPPPPSTGQHAAAPDKPAIVERAGPAAKPSVSMGEWMVQLGVFRNHSNAERLAQQLKEQGFHALVSESVAGGQPLWRVRAGPVAERAAAEQLGAKLRTAGHAGSVVPR
jgi:DedD protein